MTNLKLYEENLERIQKTIRFEKTDRPPVAPCGTSFCAQMAGVSMAEYCAAGPGTADIHLQCWAKFDHMIDAVHGTHFMAEGLSARWMSRVKIPGIDLPDDQMWQVDEQELMTIEDYHAIIDGGFKKWESEFIRERLGDPLTKLEPLSRALPESMRKHREAGIVPMGTGTLAIPFETLCGARSMPTFMMDLIRRPDLVRAAIETAAPEVLAADRENLRRTKPVAVWIGGWRTASELLSPKIWRELVWPYFKQTAEMVIEEGVIPIYHLDSNWDRDLEYFLELPRHKAIMALDGATDIRLAHKVLYDHTAVLGDVPPAMMAFSEPAEVKAYVKNLISDFGGRGYMAAVGCDAPYNTKPENMAALIDAAYEV